MDKSIDVNKYEQIDGKLDFNRFCLIIKSLVYEPDKIDLDEFYQLYAGFKKSEWYNFDENNLICVSEFISHLWDKRNADLNNYKSILRSKYYEYYQCDEIENLQDRVVEFSNNAFKSDNNIKRFNDILNHLILEIEEFRSNPSKEEAADCLLLLLDSIGKTDIEL